jgi:glycerate kinase
MRIIVAPDKFKGSLSAPQVADALARGLRKKFPRAEIVRVPVADGGEGTVDALVAATGGKIFRRRVRGPLGKPVTAAFGILPDRTAVVEMSAASGLHLLKKSQRNPLRTTTFGAGELIRAAIFEKNCRKIIVGVGGSATVDGGIGAAEALGVRFSRDKTGKILRIDASNVHPKVRRVKIVVACDVTNPLVGPRGAARVFGPQKGATPKMVKKLEARLQNLADVVARDLKISIGNVPRGGAAGGLSAGLRAFFGAKLENGAQRVLKTMKFSQKIRGASLVVTGEGSLDRQTLSGKAPFCVAKMAKKLTNARVVAVAGRMKMSFLQQKRAGFDEVFSLVWRKVSEGEAIRNAKQLLEETAMRISLPPSRRARRRTRGSGKD